MAVDVNSALNRAYEELRNIDFDLSALSGVQDRFSTRKRPANDSGNVTNTSNDRRILDGGRRIIVGPEGSAKRSRYDDALWNEQHQNSSNHRYPQREYSPPSRSQRTLSSVIMSSTSGASTIETKSRNAIITEKKKNETKEDAVRNRRLFSNLLVRTLCQFQNEEKIVGVKGQAQLEKQREVERRLEENEKENRERLLRLIELRREEMDRELKRLGTFIISGNGNVMKQEIEEDSEDENLKQSGIGGRGPSPLKSAIVVKKETQIDENEVNIGPIIVSSTNKNNVVDETINPTKSVVIDGEEEEDEEVGGGGGGDEDDENIEENNNNVVVANDVEAVRNGDNADSFEGHDEGGENV
ncbi:Pinin_SDK_memA domain-containing protein [Meloidogyne graminicola]|uniref:Pinin_SDK_memA domain-containing protein n=1 Tax=Meloidogyne graminicola TaxID=189291 RepID=A0A8T0A3I9_9BILA|nr:Pinin_SDK_memA domain-containing protein [Meloidogyne graminicola]